MNPVITQTYLGLNLDSVSFLTKPGQLTYTLNSLLQAFDGKVITYGNDYGNELCVNFPSGFVVIGKEDIIEDNETIYFLTNPLTGDSEIGIVSNPTTSCISLDETLEGCKCEYILNTKLVYSGGCCNYRTLVNSKCLNFKQTNPVRVEYKKDNCFYHIYFTDRLNPPRYIDYNNPLGFDSCGVPNTVLNCNELNVFPQFCKPDIQPTQIEDGGQLKAGAYQGAIFYSDKYGNKLTDCFEPSHPTFIYDRKITTVTDYITTRSIRFKIDHKTTIFDYFTFVIFETINSVVTPKIVGTYNIKTKEVIYTGNHLNTDVSLLEVLKRTPQYRKAGIIGKSTEYLFFADLEANLDYNFRPISDQISLKWKTLQVPVNRQDDYINGVNAGKYRTFQRDEVYPIGIKYFLNDSTTSCVDPLIGRPSRLDDIVLISSATNKDAFTTKDPCDDEVEFVPTYKVYNTATNFGKVLSWKEEYATDDCNIHEYEYGEFAYWESTELYPCDENVWGILAGKPIRHFKFPDNSITHIHDTPSTDYEYDHNSFIYPIGIFIDEQQIDAILRNTKIKDPLTGNYIPAKDLICGFELVYGNRVNNKSVIAKGLTYDVARFEDPEKPNNTCYYPNYPLNDPLTNTGDIEPFLYKSEKFYQDPKENKKFEFKPFDKQRNETGFLRYTFHSPDTEFHNPKLGTELKLEVLEYGVNKGHFTNINEHPRHRLLTEFDVATANLLAILTAFKTESGAALTTDASVTAGIRVTQDSKVTFDNAAYLANYDILINSIEKAIPHKNYAFQFTTIGKYNNFKKIPNTGYKRRPLDIALYATPNNLTVDDDLPLHNYLRESSVYLKTNSTLHRDNTKLSSYQNLDEISNYPLSIANTSEPCEDPNLLRENPIRSFYASIKRYVPDQYGQITDIEWKTTSSRVNLNFENGHYILSDTLIFGGDTFITPHTLKRKQVFFSQNMISRPDGIPFDYDLVPNIGYPKYFFSTSGRDNLFNTVVKDPAVWIPATVALASYITAKLSPEGNSSKVISEIANLATLNFFNQYRLAIEKAGLSKSFLDCDPHSKNNTIEKLITDLISLDIVSLISDAVKGIATLLKNPGQSSTTSIPLNADTEPLNLFYRKGKFYLASMAIPIFFVESDVNTYFRHGSNDKERNFHEPLNSVLPDNWLQPNVVPYIHDNSYEYNRTYSIQNNLVDHCTFTELPKECLIKEPNRIIYSDVNDIETNIDEWLIFRPNNYYDFSKANGRLIGVNSVYNDQVLVQFQNTSKLFNARYTLQSNTPLDIEIGNGALFANKPVDIGISTTGYGGTQGKAFINTKYGSFWVDAKRGQVFGYSDKVKEITLPNQNWFKQHLPFKIQQYFPDVDVDNPFYSVGISLGWDERFQRLLLTKLDFIPKKDSGVYYKDGEFFFDEEGGTVRISPRDYKYFEDRSFTMSYSPLIENWVSFHSFLPNYYNSFPDYFQTGSNYKSIGTVWTHNLSPLIHQYYNNKKYPWIIEYPIITEPVRNILQSISYNQEILRYYNFTDFVSCTPNNKENYNISFNKCIIYNNEQTTGLLNLIEQPLGDLKSKMLYPKYTKSGIDILYSKRDNIFSINNIFDITRSFTNHQPMFTTNWNYLESVYPIDKVLNPVYVDTTRLSYKKLPIKSHHCKVRFIQDEEIIYKYIQHFSINKVVEDIN